MNLALSLLSLLYKGRGLIFETTLISSSKYGRNLPYASEKKYFSNSVSSFALEGDVVININKLEFLSTKNALCQVELKMTDNFF